MSCDLSNIKIHFVESGIKVRPFSLDIRRSRRNSNSFDHVQAKLTTEAGDHIIDNHVEREPVEIIATEDGDKLYRGWYTADAVSMGESSSFLEIQDPRKILKSGTIDQEWGRITLKNVVNYIFERRIDPHNVLTEVDFIQADVDEMKLQFENAGILNEGQERTVEDSKSPDGATNFLFELSPVSNGDGNFDFREESPHTALAEVVDIWETSFWVTRDGRLVIAHPDVDLSTYKAGRGADNWHISEWNLPENATPLKAVVVKGKMDQKGGKDNNVEELWNVVTNKKKFQTRAAAGFLDDDNLSEVIVLDGKKETTDPQVLSQLAKTAYHERHTQNNYGSITIDPMVDNEIPISEYANVDIGDMLFVNNYNVPCEDAQEGYYDINSIKHDITGEGGWSITLEVVKSITNADKLKNRFWYFDPTDPEMTDGLADESSVNL